MAGIARPERSGKLWSKRAGSWSRCQPMADHDPISSGRLDQFRALSSEADAQVLTAKDAARLGDRLQGWPVPVWIPQLALEVSSGEAALRLRVLSALQ